MTFLFWFFLICFLVFAFVFPFILTSKEKSNEHVPVQKIVTGDFPERKSGIKSGDLDGEWKIYLTNDTVSSNPNFKIPEYTFTGDIKLIDSGFISFTGDIYTKKITDKREFIPKVDMKIEGKGFLNNAYLIAYFITKDDKNNVGSFIADFNDNNDSAGVYITFRPTILMQYPIGLVSGHMKKKLTIN